jgi:hypothetical protein
MSVSTSGPRPIRRSTTEVPHGERGAQSARLSYLLSRAVRGGGHAPSRGRLFEGKRRRPCRAGVVWMGSGDACVALRGGESTHGNRTRATTRVPSPHNPSPAPTGTKSLPRQCHKIPTRESGHALPSDARRMRDEQARGPERSLSR